MDKKTLSIEEIVLQLGISPHKLEHWKKETASQQFKSDKDES
ncbi:hypothetical protein O9H85_23830 [Paenibacillus filicis]|uniref:IS3 family transposase n=1 Tax=Paenibacillus gyeongsangnamensis TaxID=3388067 RepID=A0ABT4QES9_9BACL|nr:hypothetical protein [Paenibacillus filicis]MCZ8515385.1 hypothetical protein [Paenibacillus filicis]